MELNKINFDHWGVRADDEGIVTDDPAYDPNVMMNVYLDQLGLAHLYSN